MDNNTLHKYKTNELNIDSILLSDDIDKALEIRLRTPLTTSLKIKLNPNKLYNIDILEKLSAMDSNITIIYGFEDVNIITFINIMKKLDNMVNPIIDTDLSILEKYLYVYNLTTHFKAYKEEDYREDDALSLFKIFEPNNDLIVCGGFAKVLFELCKRIGIKNQLIKVNTYDVSDTEYKRSSPHIRNISRIIDTKYNIDGIYINDSTWDNNLNEELYTTSLLTPYESLSLYNINIGTGNHDLFSAQSYDEFIYQLEKDSKNDYIIFKHTLNYIMYLYPEFINILNKIPSYREFNNDYNKLLSDEEFTNCIFNFIYDKCNKRISGKIIMDALVNILKTIHKDISNEEIEEYIKSVSKSNIDNYDKLFLITKEYDDGYYSEYLTKERHNIFK